MYTHTYTYIYIYIYVFLGVPRHVPENEMRQKKPTTQSNKKYCCMVYHIYICVD